MPQIAPVVSASAPKCNIKCGYCSRKHDCANESRPGVTSRLLTPEEATVKVREVMASPVVGPIIKVVGIAGPGDPLAWKDVRPLLVSWFDERFTVISQQ